MRSVALARDIHPAFVRPGRGVIWKMKEDLSAPYPGYGLGAMDAFDGYVAFRMLDEQALAPEIAQMCVLMERDCSATRKSTSKATARFTRCRLRLKSTYRVAERRGGANEPARSGGSHDHQGISVAGSDKE